MHSPARLTYFSRYRGIVPELVGPSVACGNCLEPWLTDGGLTWYDTGLEPRAGDLVMAATTQGDLRSKHLVQLRSGAWWLVSNVMAMPVAPRNRVLGVIVVHFPLQPGWAHPYPEWAAHVNEQNAVVRAECGWAMAQKRAGHSSQWISEELLKRQDARARGG